MDRFSCALIVSHVPWPRFVKSIRRLKWCNFRWILASKDSTLSKRSNTSSGTTINPHNEVHSFWNPPYWCSNCLCGTSSSGSCHHNLTLLCRSLCHSLLRCKYHFNISPRSTLMKYTQIPCITSAASVVGCVSTDYACQCSSSASSAIAATAFDCVLSACGLVTGLDVSASADAVCTACVWVESGEREKTAVRLLSDQKPDCVGVSVRVMIVSPKLKGKRIKYVLWLKC